MFCRYCGYELKDSDRKFPGCGMPVVPVNAEEQAFRTEEPERETAKKTTYVYDSGREYRSHEAGNAQQATYTPSNDTGSVGWWFLGFFLPIVGLILFLVWKDDKPRNSRKAGIGALVGFIVQLILVMVLPMLMVWGAMYYWGIDSPAFG